MTTDRPVSGQPDTQQAACDATILDEGRPRQCQKNDGHYPATRHRSVLRDGANVVTWNDDAKDATPASSSPPRAHVRTTEYVVNCLPEDDINAPAFEIKVAYRGRNLWAVLRHGYCLGSDGEWSYESLPSGREDEWLATHRFPMERALELARTAAPDVVVNGHTVREAIARSKEQ